MSQIYNIYVSVIMIWAKLPDINVMMMMSVNTCGFSPSLALLGLYCTVERVCECE